MAEDLQKSCLYDVEWQQLRCEMLATNNTYGGFGPFDGVTINIGRCEEYLKEDGIELQDRFHRTWRILNLMNATLLGFGNAKRGSQAYDLVVKYRDEVSGYYKGMQAQGYVFKQWDWAAVNVDLHALYLNELWAFNMIARNLAGRVKTAHRKQAAGTGGMQYRGELQRFLDMMDLVEITYKKPY